MGDRARSQGITIFEVGPRDGLQNESRFVSLETRTEFIKGLIAAGVRELEIGSFVRPDLVPQMQDTELVYGQIRDQSLQLRQCTVWSLVPNLEGMARAIRAGAKNIAVFTAASETFSRKNTGMSIRKSLDVIREIIQQAVASGMKVRGYVSTAFGCPYEGRVVPKKALHVIEQLAGLGVFQVSIGDTLGVATPKDVEAVVRPAIRILGTSKVAVHFHDTRGTALANALRALELGVHTIDSAAGGLGGCPFAPGAAGNLATEDLLYLLHGMGYRTGIDLDMLSLASIRLARELNRPLSSRYLQAFYAACSKRTFEKRDFRG